MKTDLELVQLVLDGEMSAYNDLLFRYEAPIYKFVANIIKSEDIAKDISQEVFIAAYYKLYTYNKKSKFSSWLFKIAMNKSIDYMRKNRNIQQVDIETAAIFDKSISPEHYAEYKEVKKNLEDFIKTLSKTEKHILILRYSYEELTFNDIGQILNINDSTVKYKYYKIYDKYKKYISDKKGVTPSYEL